MAVTLYVHLNEEHNYNFNVKQFNEDISTKYPGTNMEVSKNHINLNSEWIEIAVHLQSSTLILIMSYTSLQDL